MSGNVQTSGHVVALRLSALGDVAMTLPVLYSVAMAYPNVRFTLLTKPYFTKLLINAPSNLSAVGFEPKRGAVALAREVMRLHPTAVADLHGVGRTLMCDAMVRLCGVRVSVVQKRRSERREALRKHLQQEPFIIRYFNVFSRLGYTAPDRFTSLWPVDKPKPVVDIKHPAVGIAPFARYANKTLPPKVLRAVANNLAERGVQVLLFGATGAEKEMLAQWAVDERIINMSGRSDLIGELATMAHLDCMVAMDSANQHLAALAGCRTITVWCSTTPLCGFAAHGATDASHIAIGAECQPCTVAGSDCCANGTWVCRQITADELTIRVLNVIDK